MSRPCSVGPTGREQSIWNPESGTNPELVPRQAIPFVARWERHQEIPPKWDREILPQVNPNIGIKEKTPISFFGTPMCYLVAIGVHGVNHYSMKCKLAANRKPAISRQIHSLQGCLQVPKPAGVDRWRGIFARFCQGFSNVLPRLSGLSFVTDAVNTGTRERVYQP